MIFRDRVDAGKKLGKKLLDLGLEVDCVVGLLRGGVVVAKEVAQYLNASLDVLSVRKIGAPFNPEYAIGALGPSGPPILNDKELDRLRISEEALGEEIEKERAQAKRREQFFRSIKTDVSFENKRVLIVDDGLATGYTMRAAISSMRSLGADKIFVAVPVTSFDGQEEVAPETDGFYTLYAPIDFMAVGQFYDLFFQVEDEEVLTLLKNSL